MNEVRGVLNSAGGSLCAQDDVQGARVPRQRARRAVTMPSTEQPPESAVTSDIEASASFARRQRTYSPDLPPASRQARRAALRSNALYCMPHPATGECDNVEFACRTLYG